MYIDSEYNKVGGYPTGHEFWDCRETVYIGDIAIIWEINKLYQSARFFDICLVKSTPDNNHLLPTSRLYKNQERSGSPYSYYFQKIRSFEELKNGEEWFGSKIMPKENCVQCPKPRLRNYFITNAGGFYEVGIKHKIKCCITGEHFYSGDFIIGFKGGSNDVTYNEKRIVANTHILNSNYYIKVKRYSEMNVEESFKSNNENVYTFLN